MRFINSGDIRQISCLNWAVVRILSFPYKTPGKGLSSITISVMIQSSYCRRYSLLKHFLEIMFWNFYSSSKFVSKPKSSFVAHLVITSHFYLRGTGLNHVETRISGHIFWLLLPIFFDRSLPARIVSFSDTIRRAKCHVFILTMIVD